MAELKVSLPPEVVQELQKAGTEVSLVIPPELLAALLVALKAGGGAVLAQLETAVASMNFGAASPLVKAAIVAVLRGLSNLLNNLVIPAPAPAPTPTPAPTPQPQPKPGGAGGVTVDVG